MRLAKIAFAALLLLLAAPAEAPAQDFGRILRPIVRPVDSLLRNSARRILRPYVYRGRARALRAPAASRRAVAQEQDQASRQQIALGQVAQPKPFWPDAPQHIADYLLFSKGGGLWGHGYGAIVVSMFAQPAEVAGQRSIVAHATSSGVEQTTGAAPGVNEMVCGEREVNRAEETEKQIAGMLALTDNQQRGLAELRSALQQTDEDIVAACPGSTPASVSERLRTMQDRVWATRVAAGNLRVPVQTFYEALTDEQKAKLDSQPPRSEGTNASSNEAAMQCYAVAQMVPQWPATQIVRALRLNKDQQASLAALNETFSQMNQMMMGACPQETQGAVARLGATLDWLDAMLFAGTNLAVAVDDFYRDLTDEQKARFDKFDL
jgi:hypothetical protein